MDTPDRSNSPRSSNARRTATTDELLAHAGWVRALSRVLVADPNAAEDIEQDAWVAALKRPPEAGDGLRAWWSRVVRNEASDARRASSRRQARELAAPTRSEVETPLEANSALEAQRKLVSAIDALEEPLRATVIRRYVQGMSSPEIAKLDGVSESTVRTRLQRALESLRRELDEKTPGGRAAWSALLAPLARMDEALPVAATVVGMSLASKLALSAVAAVVVLSGVLLSQFPAPDESPTRHAGGPAANATPGAEPLMAAEPAVAPRAEIPGDSGDSTASPVSEPVATITARFVTSLGTPIPGATLTSMERSSTTEFPQDGLPTAISGANGRVELTLRDADRSRRRSKRGGLPPETWDVSLEVGGHGWARSELRPTASLGSHTELGDIVLEPGAQVRVRCVRDDGASPAEISVRLMTPDLSLAERQDARNANFGRYDRLAGSGTDPNGSCVLRGVPIGAYRIYASADGLQQAISDAFELLQGDDLVLPDLMLARNDHAIRGRVLAPDGTPCADATIEWPMDGKDAWVGENSQQDGSFLLPSRSSRPIDVCADIEKPEVAYGYARAVAPGSTDVILQLNEPRWIDVLVTDEAGAPIEFFGLGWRHLDGRASGSTIQTRAGGRDRVLARMRPMMVSVHAPGYAVQERGPFTIEEAPATLTIALPLAAIVRGTIRREGEPMPRTGVHLSPAWSDARTRRDGLSQRVGKSITSASTDEHGAFVLSASEAGRYVVWSRLRDSCLLESEVLQLDPQRPIDGVILDTQVTGSLEGRILRRPGAESESAQIRLSSGLPWAREVAVASDGTFAVEGLSPGTWWLRVAAEPRDRDELLPVGETVDDPTLHSVVIATQRTTHIEIDLRNLEPRVVEGVIRLDGQAPARWTAALLPESEKFMRRTAGLIGADGTFRVASEWVGGHTLSLLSSGTERRDDRIDARVVIGAHPARFEFASETGTLDLTGPANALRELRIGLAVGATWITNFRFDAEGRALLAGLPFGTAQLRTLGGDAVVFEILIAARTPTHFTVP